MAGICDNWAKKGMSGGVRRNIQSIFEGFEVPFHRWFRGQGEPERDDLCEAISFLPGGETQRVLDDVGTRESGGCQVEISDFWA